MLVLGLVASDLGYCAEDEVRFEMSPVGEETVADLDAGYNRFGRPPQPRPAVGAGVFEFSDGGEFPERSWLLEQLSSQLFSCETIEGMMNVALDEASTHLLEWLGYPIAFIERAMTGLSSSQKTKALTRAVFTLIAHHDAALDEWRKLEPGATLDPDIESDLLPPLAREAFRSSLGFCTIRIRRRPAAISTYQALDFTSPQTSNARGDYR